MRTEASVDLLRKTLTRQGHIFPTKAQRDSECIILNQGEYLVSLMSHDESLLDLLEAACEPNSAITLMSSGNREEGLRFTGTIGRDLDLWVDTVKFVWLLHGAHAALDLIQTQGLYTWTANSLAQRHRYVDDLVLIAQKKLRESGAKYSDMAEFFADAEAAKAVSELH
jgi:hypothetical protein